MEISYNKIKIANSKKYGYYLSIDNDNYVTSYIILRLNISYEDFSQVMKICNAKVINYDFVFDSEYDDFIFEKKEDIEQAITMLQMLKG